MLEEKVLKEVQGDLPLVSRPFLYLARRLGVTEGKLIDTLESLKDRKIIRQISPIYDTRAVGYDSALVAFEVPESKIEEVTKLVNSHPGVSHNYLREYTFNVWFTIAVPPDALLTLDNTVELIAQLCGVKRYVILRTIKTYKIGVRFDFSALEEKEAESSRRTSTHIYELSPLEKEVVRITQEDIPLVPEPFALIASYLSIDEKELLNYLRSFKSRGIMRRFSAILYHRRAGFKANGMVVWQIPQDKVDEAGSLLASFKSVSHCYLRTTNHLWQYNLFSMVHGRNRKEVVDFVQRLKELIKPLDYRILFSTTEFKKRRVKLFSEEFYEWERKYMGAYAN